MQVFCRKCGATAQSKCPRCRNVFPDDQEVGYLKEVVSVDIGRYAKEWCNKDGHDLIVTSTLRDRCHDPYAGLQHLLERLRRLSDPQLQRLCCRHEWEHTVDCSFCDWRKPDVQ